MKIESEMRAQHYPLPQRRSRAEGHRIAIGRNLRRSATAHSTDSILLASATRPHIFAGRATELSALHRWADDSTVRLIAVTAWGGAGKTALVNEWLDQLKAKPHAQARRLLFSWDFGSNGDARAWAEAVLDRTGGRSSSATGIASAVINAIRSCPTILVLDGLEVLQGGPNGQRYGYLLDGMLCQVLTAACRVEHDSLIVLTCRRSSNSPP